MAFTLASSVQGRARHVRVAEGFLPPNLCANDEIQVGCRQTADGASVSFDIARVVMKRLIFKLKPEPADDRKEDQEWRNYSVAPETERKKSFDFACFALAAVLVAVGLWTGAVLLSFVTIVVVVWLLLVRYYPPDRCPQCKGLVKTRMVQEGPNSWRFYKDCPICKVSWKSRVPYTLGD